MGYTHYYGHSQEIKQEAWDKFLEDVKKIANTFNLGILQSVDFIKDGEGLIGNPQSDIRIGDGSAYGNEDGGIPTFNKDEIEFNGVGNDSCETFSIQRTGTDTFTKTNRRDYDIMVAATLVLYKHHFPHAKAGCDDGADGFKEAIKLCEEVLGFAPNNPEEDDDE